MTASVSGRLVPHDWRRLLALWGASRLAFYLWAVLSVNLLPQAFNSKMYEVNPHWPPGDPGSWLARLKAWDGQHYLHLAQSGYHAGDASAAFFPLWPLLIRLASSVHGEALIAALVLSNALIALAILMFIKLGREAFSPEAARFGVILLGAYPGAMFFGLVYTESLFLCLAVLAFAAMKEDRWWWAGVAGFALPMTRSVGCFILLPMVMELVQRYRQGRFKPVMLVAPLGVGLGLGVYFSWMALATGDPLVMVKASQHYIAQAGFARLLDLGAFVQLLAATEARHDYFHSMYDTAALVFVLAGSALLWRRSKAACVYALSLALVPAIANQMFAFIRYGAVVFPAFLALGALGERPKLRPWLWGLAVVFLLCQQLMLVRYLNNDWAS